MRGLSVYAQINTDQVMNIGRNALYFEDYILSIQYFNQVIAQKPYLAEPYYYRAIAKISLGDWTGADADISKSIEINPFIKDSYRIRAVARHNSHKFDDAIVDYRRSLEDYPDDKDLMLNMAMCNLAMKHYQEADSCLRWVAERDSTNERVYLAMAQMHLEQNDTIGSLDYLSRAIELNNSNVQAYLMRCEIYFSVLNDFKKATADMDEVIRLEPNNVSYYINRSIMRYKINDYRGTMADLDYAIALEPDNLTARYNRALLRTEVGANNKAIEDYNFVLSHDPDNYPALYNRTMLLINTGQYQQGISGLNAMLAKDQDDFVALYQRAMLYIDTGQYKLALRDVSSILAKYPNFESGYMIRAQLKQRLGDKRGYENDLAAAVNVMKKKGVHYSDFNPLRNERKRSEAIHERRYQQHLDKQEREAQVQREEIEQLKAKQRSLEESVEDVKKRFSELLVVDVDNDFSPEVSIESDGFFDEKAGHRRYRSRSRGYIQDNNVEVHPEGMFSLSYYSYDNKLNGRTHFIKEMTQVNDMRVLPSSLTLVNNVTSLSAYDAGIRFASVDYFNGIISNSEPRAVDYFGRAMDLMLLRDVDAAISDADRAIALVPDFSLAYFLRFNARCLKLEIEQTSAQSGTADATAQKMLDSQLRKTTVDAMLNDINMVIKLSPRNTYAYYNLAHLQASLDDYSNALINYSRCIELKPDLGEAYFNRGLIYMRLGDKEKGTADLSKAGELGILPSYNILKRMAP
jgi:tetratricopeptide (TPR) repeat protein